MGKRAKNKTRNPRKVTPRMSSSSPDAIPKKIEQKHDVSDDGVKERELCKHYDKNNAETNRILLGIVPSSSADVKCEYCREDPATKGGSKGKGKASKKKGGIGHAEMSSESNLIWVCLDCNRFACGGGVSDSVPYGHSRRHAKQERHSLAVRFDNPRVGWCFMCNSSIPIEIPEGGARETKSSANVEDVWLGGNAEHVKRIGNGDESLGLERGKWYAVRGLMNLGNTCFFNSILQNIFAMDMLRDYFMKLDQPMGPLTGALKKLFNETGVAGTGCKGAMNPKTLFGCICSKAPQFRGYQQQDSHELLRYLLDGLHLEEMSERKLHVSSDEDKRSLSSGTTSVDAFFGGQLSSTVRCVECGHTSTVYEGFLDLSLPVPSKKVPPKKAPVALPKRTKMPMREGNKGRRVRERGISKGVILDHCKTENICLPSKSSGSSSAPALEQEQTVALSGEDDSWWLDYAGPSTTLDYVNPGSQSCVQDSESAEISLSESNLLPGCKSQSDNCSKKTLTPFEPSRESCSGDDGPELPNSVVLLFPNRNVELSSEEVIGTATDSQEPADVVVDNLLGKESKGLLGSEERIGRKVNSQNLAGVALDSDLVNESSAWTVSMLDHEQAAGSLCPEDVEMVDATINESTGLSGSTEACGTTVDSQDLREEVVDDTPVNDPNVGTSSAVSHEQAEVDFDGFGGLFDEPETTTDLMSETGVVEESEAFWGAGNISESNQDEVDNTDAPVSVDTCLAYFTKPELLSGEHAWHCERCSKVLRCQDVENKKAKQQAVNKDNHSGEGRSQNSGYIVKNENYLPCFHGDNIDSAAFEIVDNGKLTDSSEGLVSYVQRTDTHAVDNGCKKPLSHVIRTDCNACRQSGNAKSLELSESGVIDQKCHPKVLKKDEGLGDRICHRLSCTLGDQDNSYVKNKMKSDGCDNRALEGASKSLLEEETIPPSSNANDNLSEVEQVEKSCSKLSIRVPRTVGSENEEMEPENRMVKRDATKRILINKAPPILTIHLKRFSQDARGRLSKLNGHVSFRETIDLRPHMDSRCGDRGKYYYRLVGVVEHSGSMRWGHYVAYVRCNKSRGKTEKDGGSSAWFHASDAHVREVSLTEVLQSEAYILFYEKVEV